MILLEHPIDRKRFCRMADGSIYVIWSRGYTSADRVARLAGHCTLYNVHPHLFKKTHFFIRLFSVSRRILEKRIKIINVGSREKKSLPFLTLCVTSYIILLYRNYILGTMVVWTTIGESRCVSYPKKCSPAKCVRYDSTGHALLRGAPRPAAAAELPMDWCGCKKKNKESDLEVFGRRCQFGVGGGK